QDYKWLLSHWYPARPARLDPETRAPTESSDLNVLLKKLKEVWRPPETAAINPGSRDPQDLVPSGAELPRGAKQSKGQAWVPCLRRPKKRRGGRCRKASMIGQPSTHRDHIFLIPVPSCRGLRSAEGISQAERVLVVAKANRGERRENEQANELEACSASREASSGSSLRV